MYYSSVVVEEEQQRKFRLSEARKAKRKREQKPLREKFIRDYRANPLGALSQVEFKEFQVDDQKSNIGRLPNTHVWVAVATRPSGRESVMAFDFSDVSEERESEVPNAIAKNIFKSRILSNRNILA